MQDVFTVECGAISGDTRVVGFRGSEGISRPYAFDLFLQIDSAEFEIADALDAKATLTILRPEGQTPFVFQGILADLELLNEYGGRALVRGRLVPQLWQLGLSLHSRIFTDQSIPDIIKKVLDDAGVDSDAYTLKLTQSYKPHEHVCQYQESDLAFISRWMEREGMYYFFEHGDAREKLVIADAKSAHEALGSAPIRFHALAGGDGSAGEHLHTFTCHQRSLPARVRLKDYDYGNPTLDVSGTARVSKTGVGEVSVYGARFFTPDDGKRLAKLRSEELLSREVVFHGTGSAAYLRSGYLFEVQGHGRAAFDAKYLAVEVTHQGSLRPTPELARLTGIEESSEVYRAVVTAIPEKTQFRAELATPWPRIYGFENGVIDGPADSEYAQIDDGGRYAVKFMFDESDLKDGKASTWVRMLQPHGGGIEGFHFPLRKGTEVLLTFLGGDPDRPVIAGVVPNAVTPSPVTKTNHTTNVIQTGGRNRFELEDEKGSERITLSTPHKNTFLRMGAPNDPNNLYLSSEGVGYMYIGAEYSQHVVGAKKEWADNTVDEIFKGPFSTTVTNKVNETYNADQETTITSGWTLTINGGGLMETIAGGVVQGITGGVTRTVSGGTTHDVTGDWNFSASGAYNLTNAATMSQTVPGAVKLTWGPTIIKAPSVFVDCPDWKVKSPAQDWLTATAKQIFGDNTEINGTKVEFVGAGVEYVITKSELCAALHIETVGVHVETVGAHIETVGFHKDIKPAQVAAVAARLWSGGIQVLGAGLTKLGL